MSYVTPLVPQNSLRRLAAGNGVVLILLRGKLRPRQVTVLVGCGTSPGPTPRLPATWRQLWTRSRSGFVLGWLYQESLLGNK